MKCVIGFTKSRLQDNRVDVLYKSCPLSALLPDGSARLHDVNILGDLAVKCEMGFANDDDK